MVDELTGRNIEHSLWECIFPERYCPGTIGTIYILIFRVKRVDASHHPLQDYSKINKKYSTVN